MKENLTRRAFLTASALGAASLVVPIGTAFGSPTDAEIQELYQRYIDNQGEYAAGKQLLEEAIAAKNGMRLLAAPDMEVAIDWAVRVANNNTIGYEWGGWGPEYDCGHFVIAALRYGGFDVGNPGSTMNMRSEFSSHGWQVLTNFGDLKRGDVLLNDTDHAALYIGGGQLVEASGNFDGLPGDSSGTEIRVRGYYWYPWNCVLRYPLDPNAGPNVQLFTCNGSDAQKWCIVENADGHQGLCTLMAKSCDKYLDIHSGIAENGRNIQVFYGNSSIAQKWRLEVVNNAFDSFIKIHSAVNDAFVLDCQGGGTTDGTNIQLFQNSNNNAAQQFTAVWAGWADGRNWYYLINHVSGKALDVFNGGW